MSVDVKEAAKLQRQMDDITDVVCRGLAAAFPDGMNYRIIAGTLAVTALGFLQRDGCTDAEAKAQLIDLIRSAPLHDLTIVDIKNND